MPISLLKQSCHHCGKSFFTYEQNMEFCNQSCEGKFKYNEAMGNEQPERVSISCSYCGEEVIRTTSSVGRKNTGKVYCNFQCRKNYTNEKRRADREQKEPSEKPKNRISYEELNRRAEIRRVMDEKHAYWYIRRGSS